MASSIFISPFGISSGGIIIPTGPMALLDGTVNAPLITSASDTTFGLWREGNGILGISRKTNPTVLRIYNTYTSSTSFERFSVDWQTASNLCIVGARFGSAGGTVRSLLLFGGNSGGSTTGVGILLNRSTAPHVRIALTDTGGLFGTVSVTSSPWIELANNISSATSGTITPVVIIPTYNQASGTAANTDLLINRTQTAIGSGAQRLLDLQVGGVTKLSVDNTGVVYAGVTAGFTGTVTPVTTITVIGGIVTNVA